MADSSSPSASLSWSDEGALRALKARYFRAVDSQDWQVLRTVFTDDARFDGFAFDTPGLDGFIEGVSSYLNGVVSVHHGFTPEYRSIADDRARGIWVMEDYLFWPPGTRDYKGVTVPGQWGIRGFGHYEEEYRSGEHGWQISFMRLSRVRVEPLTGSGYETPPYQLARKLDDWFS